MPSIETINLVDYAVLWRAATSDNYGGIKVYAPIEIRVRWEGSKTEATSPKDTVQSKPVEVFVDREIEIGSILWHGRLTNLPDSLTNLSEVTGTSFIPDIKNRNTQRTVTLTRHGNTLPDIAS